MAEPHVVPGEHRGAFVWDVGTLPGMGTLWEMGTVPAMCHQHWGALGKGTRRELCKNNLYYHW